MPKQAKTVQNRMTEFKKWLWAHGVTIRQLAECSGLSMEYIQKISRRVSPLTPSAKVKLSAGLARISRLSPSQKEEFIGILDLYLREEWERRERSVTCSDQ